MNSNMSVTMNEHTDMDILVLEADLLRQNILEGKVSKLHHIKHLNMLIFPFIDNSIHARVRQIYASY